MSATADREQRLDEIRYAVTVAGGDAAHAHLRSMLQWLLAELERVEAERDKDVDFFRANADDYFAMLLAERKRADRAEKALLRILSAYRTGGIEDTLAALAAAEQDGGA